MGSEDGYLLKRLSNIDNYVCTCVYVSMCMFACVHDMCACVYLNYKVSWEINDVQK